MNYDDEHKWSTVWREMHKAYNHVIDARRVFGKDQWKQEFNACFAALEALNEQIEADYRAAKEGKGE